MNWKTSSGVPIFSEAVWDLNNAKIISSFCCCLARNGSNFTDSAELYTIFLTKRGCTINTLSCRWKGCEDYRKTTNASIQRHKSFNEGSSVKFSSAFESGEEAWLQHERYETW